MRTIIGLLGVAALVLTGGPAGAQAPPPCDFVTGGGTITTDSNTKANFGVGGSCKPAGDGHTLWGHLEYIDHGFDTDTVNKLNVHWIDITGYFFCFDKACTMFVDPPGQPTGTRLICGTATTNLPSPDNNVKWAVKVSDKAEAGKGQDTFMINVAGGSLTYTSGDHTLTGGNIQLHKPNDSGSFSGMPTDNCPGFVPPTGGQCTTNADCNGNGTGTGEGVCETGTGVCGCPSGETFFPQCGCCSDGPPPAICQESFPGAGDFQCIVD